jgi:hypothetical protein
VLPFKEILSAEEQPGDANIFSILTYLLQVWSHRGRATGWDSSAWNQGSLTPRAKLAHGVPPFDAADPHRNVIAYSLWGTNKRYLFGAERNAMIALLLYEGWLRYHPDKATRRARAPNGSLPRARPSLLCGLVAQRRSHHPKQRADPPLRETTLPAIRNSPPTGRHAHQFTPPDVVKEFLCLLMS